MNPFDLRGTRALITGSGQGIGFAIARALGAAGASVVLNGRGPERLAAAATTLRGEGFDVLTAAFDVTDAAAVTGAVDAIEAEHGAIDILVNNAGVGGGPPPAPGAPPPRRPPRPPAGSPSLDTTPGAPRRAPLDRFTDEDWHAIVRANLDSVFFMARAVARHMIGRGRGKIINIGSVQSELGRQTIAPYAATKGAVKMLTRGMCADWARHGIQANGLAPGYFRTALNQVLVDDPAFSDWLCRRTPAGRWGEVAELGGTAVFLASAASDFVNGQMIVVDGGLTAVV